MQYLFYCRGTSENSMRSNNIDCSYSYSLWGPSISKIVPKGVSLFPFGIWWGFHHLRLFANRDYSLFLIYANGALIHRSGVFPRYFRYPFMGKEDIQIGDTWTEPEHRGKGLATFALQKIVEIQKRPSRKFWYITESRNISSQEVAKKAGFIRVGEGERTKRMGVEVLGAFVIRKFRGGDSCR